MIGLHVIDDNIVDLCDIFNIIDLCKRNEIDVFEKDFSLFDVYSADEAFVTGTFGGVAHVSEVDGRVIGDGKLGSTTRYLRELYADLLEEDCPPGG